eukprot:NODE_4559_length_792_cov_70.220727_g4218_i0.p1 GENE.NODE_4559_length_792_cov_70.220727_g4218_i0~~NODE_4559_length_792_cov_70.220727_g4218_i0.p1  ORF type:complete len:120 (-),score=15.59 NODE_4559_length_792_cov_70.220727_g4218_i0:161-520(-)
MGIPMAQFGFPAAPYGYGAPTAAAPAAPYGYGYGYGAPALAAPAAPYGYGAPAVAAYPAPVAAAPVAPALPMAPRARKTGPYYGPSHYRGGAAPATYGFPSFTSPQGGARHTGPFYAVL